MPTRIYMRWTENFQNIVYSGCKYWRGSKIIFNILRMTSIHSSEFWIIISIAIHLGIYDTIYLYIAANSRYKLIKCPTLFSGNFISCFPSPFVLVKNPVKSISYGFHICFALHCIPMYQNDWGSTLCRIEQIVLGESSIIGLTSIFTIYTMQIGWNFIEIASCILEIID